MQAGRKAIETTEEGVATGEEPEEGVATGEEEACVIALSLTNEIIKEAVMEATCKSVIDDIMDHVIVNHRQQSKEHKKLLCPVQPMDAGKADSKSYSNNIKNISCQFKEEQATEHLVSSHLSSVTEQLCVKLNEREEEIKTEVTEETYIMDKTKNFPRVQQKRSAKSSTENESPFKKSNIIKVFMDKKSCSVKIEKLQASDEKVWYDGKTFNCSKCDFTFSSKQHLSEHNRKEHGTSLGQYQRTDVRYVCHCCGNKVYHEKGALQEHLKTHCLTLVEYNRLYGSLRKRIKKERKRKKRVTVVYTEASELLLDLKEPSVSRSSSTDNIKEEEYGADKKKRTPNSSDKQVLRSNDFRDVKKQVSDTFQNPKKDNHRKTEELFIYLCPVADCHFAINLQVCMVS